MWVDQKILYDSGKPVKHDMVRRGKSYPCYPWSKLGPAWNTEINPCLALRALPVWKNPEAKPLISSDTRAPSCCAAPPGLAEAKGWRTAKASAKVERRWEIPPDTMIPNCVLHVQRLNEELLEKLTLNPATHTHTLIPANCAACPKAE